MWRTLNERQIRESAVRDVAMRTGVSPPRARQIVQARLDMVSDSLLDASARRRFNGWLIRLELVEPFLLYRSTISDLRVEETDLRESTGDWLRWFSGLCAEMDIRPWVVYFPAAPLVQPGPWGTFEDRHYDEAPDIVGDRSVAEFLETLCLEHGIRFIDATETLKAHTDEKLFHRWDTHPTARAYQLVALEVERAMLAELVTNRDQASWRESP
jgi:hypothetical protein